MSNLNCYCAVVCRFDSFFGWLRVTQHCACSKWLPARRWWQSTGNLQSTASCSPKTEPKVTVICSRKPETKVAKKFKRKSSIPIQFCLSKREPKVTVFCSRKPETKVAKKFKRKSSIPIQFCLSKHDNIEINQCIEMSQDLNTNTCSCLVIFIY